MKKRRSLYVSQRVRGILRHNLHKKWLKSHMKKQIGCCYYCSRKVNNMTLEHKQPLSRDGEDHYENTAASCKWCNQDKGSMTEQEYLDYRSRIGTPRQMTREQRSEIKRQTLEQTAQFDPLESSVMESLDHLAKMS